MKYAIAALVVGMLSLGGWAMVPGDGKLTVHEWGTFTSVSGVDGVPIPWKPLGGPPDLPTFVFSNRWGELLGKGSTMATIRMETPVLYFYPERAREVDVKVGFPQGRVTEWYPKAVTVNSGIDWGRVQLRPGTAPEFPREAGESHYYPARETDAAPVRVADQDEKFLFYRGVGLFGLPVEVRLSGETIVVKNLGKGLVPQAILFERRGGRSGFRVLGPVRGEVATLRPELTGRARDLDDELERVLVQEGLYEKEARAMIRTWHDSWFEEGLRLFYIMPPSAVDSVLPLTIRPSADQVTRVFVGRAELITPEMEAAALDVVQKSGADLVAARKQLSGFGRFRSAVLARLLPSTTDPVIRTRIANLMVE